MTGGAEAIRSTQAGSVALFIAVVLCVGCGHDEPFTPVISPLGPPGQSTDLQITYNVEQDYWPMWSEDGTAIVYAYVTPEPGPQHRCIGMLPANGGTRLWQFCDNRGTQFDSISSFPAYAVGSDGRLLYVEAVSSIHGAAGTPDDATLWLADTATPFARRPLLTLPTFAGSTSVRWLADLAWTGRDSFIGLAMELGIFEHCRFCSITDTAFFGTAVVRGTITGSGATLQVVPGTEGATAYSRAQDGSTIAFTRRNDGRVFTVPAAGGASIAVATARQPAGGQLVGISCRASTCVVAADVITLSDDVADTFPSVDTIPAQLRTVDLTTGVVKVVHSSDALVIVTPQVSPRTGDVVAQVGGGFGHLQTFNSRTSDLHLYTGLVP